TEIFPGIERLGGPVDQVSLPISVLFAQSGDHLWTPPAAGLIDVPGHLGHHDVADLTRLEKFVRAHVARRGPSLRADLNDLLRCAYELQRRARIAHDISEGLFDIDVFAGSYRPPTVISVADR